MADGDSSDTLQGEDDAQGAVSGFSSSLAGDKAAKENTGVGRWTQEEHRLFLKGLELHGKGWKKIASLIKTRTVVQIRTHAQKYFLKLQKAQQNGDSAGPIMMDGKSLVVQAARKSLKSRRISDKPLAIADVLKPYVDTEDCGQPEQHLYRFLSAPLDDSGHSPLSITESGSTSGDQSNPLHARPKRCRTNVDGDHDHAQGVLIPEWFKNGGELHSLLEKASTLDWTAHPAPAAVQLPSPTTCCVSCPVSMIQHSEFLETAVESSLCDASPSTPSKPEGSWLNTETFEYLQFVVEDNPPDPDNVTELNSRKRARTEGDIDDDVFELHVPEDIHITNHHTSVGQIPSIGVNTTTQTHSTMEVESVTHGITSESHSLSVGVESGSNDHVIDSFAITNDLFDDETFSLEAMLAGET